jgi:transketolase
VYLRFGRADVPVFTTPETPFEVGKAYRVWEGKKPKVGIVATGALVFEALRAVRELEQEVSTILLNMHTIKPLDEEALCALVQEVGALITVEEHQAAGGLGSAVSEWSGKEHPLPIERVAVQDQFGQSGDPTELVRHYGLDAHGIGEAVTRALKRI